MPYDTAFQVFMVQVQIEKTYLLTSRLCPSLLSNSIFFLGAHILIVFEPKYQALL